MQLTAFKLKILPLILIGAIGLHLPRSFALLYCFAVVVFLLGQSKSAFPVWRRWGWLRSWQRRSTLLLILFSVVYVAGMIGWGFWVWPVNALDCVNALILPALLFNVGIQSGFLGRLWCTRVLIAYAIGALIYVLTALAASRLPWWNVFEIFPSTIHVGWGSDGPVNVRSVEQNAFPALILLPPAFFLILGRGSVAWKPPSALFILIGTLAMHSVWSLNGRLGWLTLLVATLPVLWIAWSASSARFGCFYLKCFVVLGLMLAGLLSLVWIMNSNGLNEVSIWSQGFCDERFSLFSSMLSRLHLAPWGGRLLRVPFTDCSENSSLLYMAVQGGVISMVHNVILDIYFSVGWVAAVLLIVAILPLIWVILRYFLLVWSAWDWQIALRWGWFSLLLIQWMFQPLAYSDGLLYFFSFFVMGLLLSEVCVDSSCDRFPEPECDRLT